ncbi:MAG: hypothetical protein ACI39E_04605 [Acutalibacteraceae bacterium]
MTKNDRKKRCKVVFETGYKKEDFKALQTQNDGVALTVKRYTIIFQSIPLFTAAKISAAFYFSKRFIRMRV